MAKVPIFTVDHAQELRHGPDRPRPIPARSTTASAGPPGTGDRFPIEGGVDAAFKRDIANAPDPDKRRAEIEAFLRQFRDPFRTAEAFGIEDLIDPRQTRSYIHRFLELAYESLSSQLGIVWKAGVRP